MAALPLGYDPARAKLTRLVRDIAAVEAAADCVAPDEMVERVQAVLDRTGWAGWRAVLRPGGDGPCGRVRRRGGLPDLLLSPFMDTAARELSVAAGPPRSLDRRLYGRESLVVDLFEASGRRCFTLPGLQEHVRGVLAVTGRKVTFKQARLPANSGMEPPRGDRYAEGCAIAVGAAPLYPSRARSSSRSRSGSEPDCPAASLVPQDGTTDAPKRRRGAGGFGPQVSRPGEAGRNPQGTAHHSHVRVRREA
ncbi:MAG: hypothetical protein ABW135_02895 [Thermoleophilaceae bacterium]